MSEPVDRAIPVWGRWGRPTFSVAATLAGALIVIGWISRGSDHFFETDVIGGWFGRAAGLALAISLAVAVLGGLVWLASEFTAGLRTPREEA